MFVSTCDFEFSNIIERWIPKHFVYLRQDIIHESQLQPNFWAFSDFVWKFWVLEGMHTGSVRGLGRVIPWSPINNSEKDGPSQNTCNTKSDLFNCVSPRFSIKGPLFLLDKLVFLKTPLLLLWMKLEKVNVPSQKKTYCHISAKTQNFGHPWDNCKFEIKIEGPLFRNFESPVPWVFNPCASMIWRKVIFEGRPFSQEWHRRSRVIEGLVGSKLNLSSCMCLTISLASNPKTISCWTRMIWHTPHIQTKLPFFGSKHTRTGVKIVGGYGYILCLPSCASISFKIQ